MWFSLTRDVHRKKASRIYTGAVIYYRLASSAVLISKQEAMQQNAPEFACVVLLSLLL